MTIPPGPYASLTNPNMSNLDQSIAALGAMGVIPCTATGTNTIALAPNANTPSLSGYANYQLFSFVAAATSTGAVQVSVASLGNLNLYKAGTIATQASTGDIVVNVFYLIAYVSSISGFVIISATAISPSGLSAPQTTVYTSGSGTYNTPAGTLYLRFRMVGGGGGGGGTTGPGGSGGNTAFSSYIAGGGSPGAVGSTGAVGSGGAGGTVSGSAPQIGINGQYGGTGPVIQYAATITNVDVAGPSGGNSPFGGAGVGQVDSAGGNASPNSGSGGGGSYYGASNFSGGGGGAGAYIEHVFTSLASSYPYTVGVAGSAGAGAPTGGAGGAGLIIVTAYFQ